MALRMARNAGLRYRLHNQRHDRRDAAGRPRMPFYTLQDVPQELVTPKHSTALGRLITGSQVEFGILSFKAGQGAEVHAHPHEQIVYVLKGRMKVFTEGSETVIGPGQAAHFLPNVPHGTKMLDDVEAISVKGVIDGVGHKT
jgi:quercetin dioxygenase-like cupin family protein